MGKCCANNSYGLNTCTYVISTASRDDVGTSPSTPPNNPQTISRVLTLLNSCKKQLALKSETIKRAWDHN